MALKLNPATVRPPGTLYHLFPWFLIALLLMLLGTHYDFLPSFTGYGPPGIIAPAAPMQAPINGVRPWKHLNDYIVTPRAEYSVTARLIFKRNYWLSGGSDVSPIDFTLAWQSMSDSKMLKSVSLSSGLRHYYWRANELLIPEDEINRSVSNHHLVPRNDYILNKLRSVPEKSLVTLKGYLVDIARPDGWHWNTSLTREDSGDGACELMWVDEVVLHNNPQK